MSATNRPPLPYEFLNNPPSFSVTSNDIADGQPIPKTFIANADYGLDGENLSPHLAWSGAPAETKSYAVTCFDPDAPTGSGFWHWVVFDIPADVTELPRGAGSGDFAGLPAGAIQARNDVGRNEYVGCFPPSGHGPHRYAFAVHALDVERLGPDASATPAFVGFNIWGHIVGRGLLVATYETP